MEARLKQGEALFAEGKIEEAEKYFSRLLENDPTNTEILNNLGVIFHRQANSEKAEGYFLKALAIKEDYLDPLLNLADLYQTAKRWKEAAHQLEKCIAIDDQDPNLYNQLGMIYLEMSDSPKAREFLAKSLKLNPDQEIVRQSLGTLDKKDASSKGSKKEKRKGVTFINKVQSQQTSRIKIAVLCLPGLQSFLGDIVDYLKTKYDVRTCYSNNNQEIESAVTWADIVWLEWANQIAIHVTNKIPQIKDKKIICRLHGYEVFTDMPAQINWSAVDCLVFVAKHKQEIFNKKFKVQSLPQTIVRNGINVSDFSIANNKQNTKRLVFIGHLNFRKGIPILLQFYHELLKVDPDYFLYIRGKFQDPRLEMAAHTMIKELSLDKKLEFVDWVEDINSWLADKSHILSFSLEESFHYTIGNGMAAGLKPVIHAWNESREIWPEEFIFNDLKGFLHLMTDGKYDPENYRKLLFENRLTTVTQTEKIIKIIEELSKNISPSTNQIISAPAQKDCLNKIVHCPWQQKSEQITPPTISKEKTDEKSTPLSRQLNLEKDSNNYKNHYRTDNPLKLLLKQDESLHDYMNLEHFLNNTHKNMPKKRLFYLLQTTFHNVITSYFNTLTIPKAEQSTASAILNLIDSQERYKILVTDKSEASFIFKLFHFLRDNLPKSNKGKTVQLKAMNNVLNSAEATDSVINLYHILKSEFKELYKDNYLSSFMIHGSMSTLDFTPFSDVDTQLFLSDKAFSSLTTIKKIAGIISRANIHLRLFDPLQHHGYFISTDLDRVAYPQSFLPLSTIENATAVLGDQEHTFSLRSSDYENKFSVWHMGYFFRVSYLSQKFPMNPFDMKRFLSRFSMLPVLYLELFENMYPYKRDSFELAREYFDPKIWSVFDIITHARAKWNPGRMVKFSHTFYRQIFEFSELILERLKELSNGQQ